MEGLRIRRGRRRSACIAAVVFSCVAVMELGPSVHAADQWVEVKSAHFLVTSNAGQGSAKTLAWQLEQIRSAIAALWSWARVDLNKPLMVLAVKDEASMRGLVPSTGRRRGASIPKAFGSAESTRTTWPSGPTSRPRTHSPSTRMSPRTFHMSR